MAKAGILFRRALKEKLIMSPPLVGELVYAIDTNEHGWLNAEGVLKWGTFVEYKTPTLSIAAKQFFIENLPPAGSIVYASDTGEHGWLDGDGKLVWSKLNRTLVASAMGTELNTSNFNGQLSSTDNNVQIAIEKLEKFYYNALFTAADINTDTVAFNNNLSPTEDNIQKALNKIDSLQLGDKNEIINPANYTGNLSNISNTLTSVLSVIDRLQLGDKNIVIDTSAFTKNLSSLDVDIQTALSTIDKLDVGFVSTGLEKITQNLKSGWRLSNTDPLSQANIGINAIDLSISTNLNNVNGASGDNSFSIGLNSVSSAKSSSAIGNSSKATGNYSTAIGGGDASGVGSFAAGINNISSGNYSTTFNSNTKAISDYSTSFGRYNVGTDINNIFEIGDGTSSTNRINLFELNRNGDITLPISNVNNITNPKNIITKEYIDSVVAKGLGNNNTSTGLYAYSIGLNTTAIGDYSTSIGENTISLNKNSFSCGMFNVGTDTANIIEVGMGTDDLNRANALEITSTGLVLAPNSSLLDMTSPKTLITKEYLDLNKDSFMSGLEKIVDVETGWRLIGRNVANYSPIGKGAIDFSESTLTSLGSSGNYSVSFGLDTKSVSDYSVSFGKYNIGTATNILEFGYGTDDLNRANALELSNTGIMSLPLSTISNILKPKDVVTKEYLEANSSTTALDTSVDTTLFNNNLSSTDVNVQTALNTIDSLVLQDTNEFIDRSLEYANIVSIDYDAVNNMTRTNYLYRNIAYYCLYTYSNDQLITEKYYLTTGDVLLLTKTYAYNLAGNLDSLTRS